VLPASRVPLRNIVVMNARDRRSIFAIPQREVVYIGTTDTTYDHGPQVWPDISRDDVDYLLEPLGRYLSVEPPTVRDVTAAWAGLRPLVAQPGKKPTDISRADEVLVSPTGVVTVAGGKLTGYRPTVERVLQDVARVLDRTLPDVEEGPLPGGDFDGDLDRLAGSLTREFGVTDRAAARLARLYGCEAADVLRLGAAPLADESPMLEGEVDWAVQEESAGRLEDVIYRRTRMALYDADATPPIVEPAAERMASLLNWDPGRTEDEIARTRARLAEDVQFDGGLT
jgi:glycerol-3-phosphate dehydrogenase